MHNHRTRADLSTEARSTANGAEETIDLGGGNARGTGTALARLLMAARQEFLAAEGHFLDRETLERELTERRRALA